MITQRILEHKQTDSKSINGRRNYLYNKVGPRTVAIGWLLKIFAIQTFAENKFEITPEQFILLSVLCEEGELYQRQISEITLKDRPNVTRIINILEKLEYVKRVSASNKRQIFKIVVTKKGREAYEKILPTILTMRAEETKGIEAAELEIYLKVLDKIGNHIREKVKLQI